MLATLLPKCWCNQLSQSNLRLPSSKSISDITVKPQACTITVPIGTFRFSAQNTILKAQNARNTITKMLVAKSISDITVNPQACTITVPIGTLRFSAQITIFKAQNARNTIKKCCCNRLSQSNVRLPSS
jgi:hypothetical protein